jgi:hypothetical protein
LWGSSLSTVENISALGSAILSQVSDLANAARVISQSMDVGQLQATWKVLKYMVGQIDKNERQLIIENLTSGIDAMLDDASLVARHSVSYADYASNTNASKLLRTINQKFFKITRMTGWSNILKKGIERIHSHNLGMYKNVKYSEMTGAIKETIDRFGLGEHWDEVRKGIIQDYSGKDYLSVRELVSQKVDNEVIDRVRAMYVALSEEGAMLPGLRDKAYITGGTRADTVGGTGVRLATQFKTFGFTLTRRVFGKFHSDLVRMESASQRWGAAGSAMSYMTMVTGMAVISDILRDISKNQTPKIFDNRELAPKLLDAFIRSGSITLMEDVWYATDASYGRGVLDALAGPAIGNILLPAAKGFGQMVHGDKSPMEVLKKTGTHILTANAPWRSFIWTRPGGEWLNDQLRDIATPGYIYRKNIRLAKDDRSRFVEYQ